MTFNDLRTQYTEDELSCFPGDNDLRFRAFSPFLQNLFEEKMVYYEKFICVVRLEDVQITSERFHATAVPHLHIERAGIFRPQSPTHSWDFGGTWEGIRLINHSLNAPYAGWSIWPEFERVSSVERLVREGKFSEALLLTLDESDAA